MTSDDEHSESRRSAGVAALIASAVIGLGAVAGVTALVLWAPWRQAAGLASTRANENELSRLREARRSALGEVWRAMERHRAATNEWPADLDALRSVEPIVEDALSAPALSRDGAYRIDFGAVRASADGGPAWVIVDDPGYRLPGAPEDDERLEAFRVVLLSTGEVVGREEARRRGARFGER